MPGSREDDFKRKNAFPLYDIWQRSSAETPAQGVMKVTILVDPKMCIMLVCSK